MTETPADAPVDALVTALRAAGCVFAEDEAALLRAQAADPDALAALLARRVAGEPLEQVLGWVEFGGLRLRVAPGVFVPRRRSELLVAEVVRRAGPAAVVVELCCGVAAIGAAASARRPDLEVWAADIDAAAVECARTNLDPDHVLLGDLYDALPDHLRGRVGVLVANAPYVPTGEIELMPREARDHEPRLALDGGADGLDVHRRIAADLDTWLAPGGTVLIEVSPAQAPVLEQILLGGGCTDASTVLDDEFDSSVVVGRVGGDGGAGSGDLLTRK